MPVVRILTRDYDDPQFATFEGYRAKGGYQTLERVLKTLTPNQVVEAVKNSGLRGRGGLAFPRELSGDFYRPMASRDFCYAMLTRGNPALLRIVGSWKMPLIN